MRQWVLAMGLLLGAPAYAAAAPIVLTFEGVGHRAYIRDFYNGGTDEHGHSGPNAGVTFLRFGATGLVDFDAGGSGNIANEPSGQTVLSFVDVASSIITVPAGFDTGFSLFFSGNSAFGNGTVSVFDGLNGSGNVLATFILNSSLTPSSGCGGGDPNGDYSCWAPAGVTFNGIARSIAIDSAKRFAGTNFIYDDVTFGSATPGGGATVPEPASLTLVGLAGLAAVTRRRMSRF